MMQSMCHNFLARLLVLDAKAQVNAVFRHHILLGMVETDGWVVFFDSHLNQMLSLSNLHLPTLTGNAV